MLPVIVARWFKFGFAAVFFLRLGDLRRWNRRTFRQVRGRTDVVGTFGHGDEYT